MNPISNLGLLATLLLPATAFAQSRVATLAQTLETFNAIDVNKDGKLSPEELVASKLRLTPSDARGVDADQDGFWSKDEFLIFYRQRLLAANVKPAADLEAEASRILAARKAKAAEQNVQRANSDARGGAKQAPAAGALSAALNELQVKASANQAKSADFDRVRDLLASEAKAADQAVQGQDPAAGESSELQRTLLQSLERLRAAAVAGKFSREEYDAFRASLVRRTRKAADSTAPAQATPGAADSNPELHAIEQGLTSALERLEQRATAGNASHEDFQLVRDQLIARARAAAKGVNGTAPAEADGQHALAAKLLQSLDRLEAATQKGAFSREEFTQLRDSMIHRAREIEAPGQPRPLVANAGTDEAGMSQAADELERRVNGGQVTAADFAKLRELIAGKAQAAAAKSDPSSVSEALVYQQLMQSLERLEKAAQNGSVDRQEFLAFKTSFIHRARKIASGAQQSGATSGTPAGTQPIPGDKVGAKRADPARDAGNKGNEQKPAPQSRQKPGGQDPDKPQPEPPQQPHL